MPYKGQNCVIYSSLMRKLVTIDDTCKLHPYCHEGAPEVSMSEFEPTVREGSCVKDKALEDFPTEGVVEGMDGELD